MSQNYEQLIEENTQLKKALIQSKSVIDRISNDYETLKQIHEDIKIHYEKSKRDAQELGLRLKQFQNDNRELEQQFDTTIRNLKLTIEQKQREIEEIQQKVIPSFDQDMLRIRIYNELEIPHRQQLEQKQLEIEKYQEQTYFLKRQLDLAEAKVETIHSETQKELKIWDEKHKIEIDDYQQQITDLHKQLEDNTDRDNLRKYKKELDEYKMRYQSILIDNEDLRNERDKIREDHNETLVKFSKQIDQERTDKRQFKSEAEKLIIRIRFSEDELRKEKIRRDQLLNDIEILKTDKDSSITEIRQKSDTIHYLQNKIRELEENHLITEQKNHENMLRLYNDEHDKYLQERNKSITTIKDLDTLKKRFSDLSEDYKALKDRYLKENQDLKEERNLNQEEKEKMKRSVNQLQRDVQENERINKMKEDQIRDLDEECEMLKKKNRELSHRLSLAETYPNEKQQQTKSPQVSQNQQKPDVAMNDDKYKNQIEKYNELEQNNIKLSNTNKKLKEKLKQANQKIMEMLTKKLNDKQQNNNNNNYQIPSQSNPQQSQFQYQQDTQYQGLDMEDDQILNQVRQITQQGKLRNNLY